MTEILDVKTRKDAVRTIVRHANSRKVYAVDTALTIDHGPETMVFPCNPKTGSISDWVDVYARVYDSMEQAYAGHEEIVENFAEYVH